MGVTAVNFSAAVDALTRRSSAVRSLYLSRDNVAIVHAVDKADAKVLTADEWPEGMAKAILVPRFLPAEDDLAWRSLWTTIGGHAAHLRRISELLIEEKKLQDRERLEEMLEKQKKEAQLIAGDRSPDAAEKAKQAAEEDEYDSFRSDARSSAMEPPESLLRRLPEAFEDEVAEIEAQVVEFARHPLVGQWQVSRAEAQGTLAAAQAMALRRHFLAPYIAAPAGGLAQLSDPLLVALLDVGLLVPKWSGPLGARLAVPNRLTRSVILAWLEAQCSELPLRDRATCTWLRWREGDLSFA